MSAGIFAIIGALAFSFDAIVIRRAVIKVANAAAGVMISAPLSVPYFLIVLTAMGELNSIARFSWQSYAWLAGAGILHFVIGRSLSYNCVQLVGANLTNILRRTSPLVAVILGISVLGEPLSWQLIVGSLLIIGGVVATGLNLQMFRGEQRPFAGIPGKAIFYGISAGLAWGTSPIMIKLGLEEAGSPVAGALVAYLAATIVLSMSLMNQNRRTDLFSMDRRAVGFFCMSGLLSSTAQLLKFIALSVAPASVVAPLFNTSPIFTIILTFLLNRKLEVFSPTVIIATIAVVAGAILLI
ncbi:EamA family transporter [Chloroflexota bacterium]